MIAFILNILDATGFPNDRSAGMSFHGREVASAIEDVIRKDGIDWWKKIINDFLAGYET